MVWGVAGIEFFLWRKVWGVRREGWRGRCWEEEIEAVVLYSLVGMLIDKI